MSSQHSTQDSNMSSQESQESEPHSPEMPFLPGLEINNTFGGDPNQQIAHLQEYLHAAHLKLKQLSTYAETLDAALPQNL